MQHFNAIIIGSGQGGNPLAKKLAAKGWQVAVVEMVHVGGSCINVGCTPTKTMIASARTAFVARQAGKYGVNVPEVSINIEKILARKNEVVDSFRDGSQKGLEKTENLQLIFGTASFMDASTIKVETSEGDLTLTADKFFINVGTRATIPPIKGLDTIDYLTSTTLMELQTIPEHLLIVGAGYIGLEFGQMYRRFGSQVTILEYSDRLLSREDADIAEEILKFLKAEEIEVITNAQLTDVEKNGTSIAAKVKLKDNIKEFSFSHILISAGRTPNTDILNATAAGISLDKHGYIEVNDQLETSVKNIFAIGDVKGGPQFTHISYHDHHILYRNLVEGKSESYHDRLVPYTMFTDPQLGRVGITEDEAREKGLDVQVATLPLTSVARAIETGETFGLMKAVVETSSGKILGAAILGSEGGEVMTVLQMAMTGGVTWQQIKDMPIAHPLFAESLNNLFMSLEKDD